MEVDTGTQSSFWSVAEGKLYMEGKKRILAEKDGIQERRIKLEFYWNKPYDIG